MKKLLALTVVCALAVTGLTACTGKNTESASSEETSTAKESIDETTVVETTKEEIIDIVIETETSEEITEVEPETTATEAVEVSPYLSDYTDTLISLGWIPSESDGSGMVGLFEENQDWTTAEPLKYVLPTNVEGQRISSLHIQVLNDDVTNADYFPYIDEDGVKQDEYVTFVSPTEEGNYHFSYNNITGEIVKSIPELMIFTDDVTDGEREFCVSVAQAMSIEYHNLLEEVQAMAR